MVDYCPLFRIISSLSLLPLHRRCLSNYCIPSSSFLFIYRGIAAAAVAATAGVTGARAQG